MEEGQKWLAVASEENWKKCLENHVWGADDKRVQQIKKMQKNDEIVVYLKGNKLAAICQVSSDYYYDDTKIWDDGIYPHRVNIEPVKIPTSPIDIKKTYHVYLGYKGSPGGYFGQAIRSLPDKEYSIFQSALARHMDELAKWDDNDFTQDFATALKVYLENKYSVTLTKKRNHIFFNSGSVIHVRGSKIHSDGTGFYYLQQKDYEDTIKNTDRFFVIVFGKVDIVFVIPSEKLKEIFKDQPVVKRENEEPKWYFDVFEDNNKKHFLRIHSNSSSNIFDIENYLNKWEQIPGLITQIEDVNVNVFVTGYDNTNVKISKEHKILGWKNKSQPSIGDLIFVYNTTTKKIECGFKIKSKSMIEKPIWHDEINSEPPHQIYKHRWEAELVCDNLNIGLEEINQIPPFKADSEGKRAKFGILVLGDAPNSLTKPIYKPFKDYLLSKVDNNKMTEQKETGQIDNGKFPESYWKIAPGEQASQWEEQLANGVIAIGWNELGDLSNRNINDITNDIKKNWPDASNSIILQIKDFLSIREGDIVIANKGISKVIGIGKIVGKYTYRPDLTFNHTYPVEWFDTIERNISPQIGIWRKTVSRISQQLYNEIIEQITNNYLLIRHQPKFKRTKNEREYWSDLLGKEYHFGKNVVNYKKIKPGTKTIWFYTDKDKLYLWGHGDVNDIITTENEDFVASFKDFTFYDEVSAAVELEQSTQNKIKSLGSWNPYNSIIEIDKETYNEILKSILQLETFDDETLSSLSDDQINKGYEKISEILLIPKDKVIEILIALISGRHVLLAGPIGTGKTRLASLIPEIFWAKVGGYWAKDYTATSDWNTQDVIGGIYPKMENGKVVYDIQYGCVVDTVAGNWELGIDGGRRIRCKSQERTSSKTSQEKKLSYRGIWLVIDEFNRADIDKAFGQLFTSLRTRNLKIPTNDIYSSYKDLRIPQDYRIIGTLNTADKHFLFQLSDALKSRFAYIEVGIPDSKDYGKEIYYAMKNAIGELNLKKEIYEDFIILDDNSKKIISGKLDADFYNFVLEAYYYLDFVRTFKKLGTAILQLIYQNMIVAIRITKDPKTALDSALVSTLLPQLENLPLTSLGALDAFYKEEKDENIIEYIKDAYKNPNRQSFVETFEKILDFLNYKDVEKKCKDFATGIIQINDTALWSDLNILLENKKKNFQSHLVQFKQGIRDLVRSAVI